MLTGVKYVWQDGNVEKSADVRGWTLHTLFLPLQPSTRLLFLPVLPSCSQNTAKADPVHRSRPVGIQLSKECAFDVFYLI